MHIRPFRKNLPVTVVTLIALGIMFFLFFMHPHSPEESLEFYTPDGNGVGSFRVDITEVLADPAYTEIKIVLPPLHGQIPQQVRNGKNPGTGKPCHRSGQGHPE